MKKRTRFGVEKLVRDKTLERCKKFDIITKSRTISGKEYLYELKKKLVEEAEEVLATRDKKDLTEELADVQEVIDVLMEKIGVDKSRLKEVREEKFKTRGSFCDGIYVEHVDAIQGSTWYEHYMSQPDKYPVLKDEVDE